MRAPRLRIVDVARLPAGGKAPAGLSLTPCADCHAPCCRTLRARLTTVEAVRISETLQVPLEDFIERVAGAEHHHPWFTVPIPLDGTTETLALRQVDTRGCTFLHNVGPRGRCSIHALRPGICRIYPYAIEQGGTRRSVGDQDLCPVGWLVDRAAEERALTDFRRWVEDIARERELVRRWGRKRKRTWEGWLAFVQGTTR